MARQRPHVRDWWSQLYADPVGKPVTERGSDRTRNPNRPEIEIAGADQNADPNQRRPGWDEQGNECKRFAEGERKNDGRRPRLRSEEHTSELQSLRHLVCRLLLEKKKKNT